MKKYIAVAFGLVINVWLFAMPPVQITEIEKIDVITSGVNSLLAVDNRILVSSFEGVFNVQQNEHGRHEVRPDSLYRNAIAFSKNGSRVWFAKLQNNISQIGWVAKKGTHPVGSAFLMDKYVKDIHFSSTNELWVGTLEGLYKSDGMPKMNLVKSNRRNAINGAVYRVIEDVYQNIWVASAQGLYVHIHCEDEWKFLPYDNGVKAITQYRNEIFWTAQSKIYSIAINDLIDLELAKEERLNGLFKVSNDIIRDIEFDKRGYLWVASNVVAGVNLADPTEVLVCDNDLIETHYFGSIDFDVAGNLWIGTLNNGLFTVASSHLDHLRKKEHQPSEMTEHALADALLDPFVSQLNSSVMLNVKPKPQLFLLPKTIEDKRVKLLRMDTLQHIKKTVLKISDSIKEDGDIIHLYHNGELILENYSLKSQHQSILIDLSVGANYFYVIAVDEGSRPSTTLQMTIGKNTYQLRSNSLTIGAVRIDVLP